MIDDDDEPDLFPHHEGAYARSADPHTSHDAAAEVDVTKLEAIVEASVARRADGETADEIALDTGLEYRSVTPRLKPLERKGRLYRDGTRIPPGRRRQATIWKARTSDGAVAALMDEPSMPPIAAEASAGAP